MKCFVFSCDEDARYQCSDRDLRGGWKETIYYLCGYHYRQMGNNLDIVYDKEENKRPY